MTAMTNYLPRCAPMLLVGMLPVLNSGCIAVAIPLAAGAAITRSQTSDGESLAPRSPASLPSGPEAVPPPSVARASAASDMKVVQPSQLSFPAMGPALNRPDAGVAAFESHALSQALLPPELGSRTSALPSAGSNRAPDRARCRSLPPAVFVDLDPRQGIFDPLAPGEPDVALAEALADLREEGVRVIWFSHLAEDEAAGVRAALVGAGFDPAGVDDLALTGEAGERKQSRRGELAGLFCPVAMLGDEPADFDERALRSGQQELLLDAMIGHGWFLASPFAPPSPATPDGEKP